MTPFKALSATLALLCTLGSAHAGDARAAPRPVQLVVRANMWDQCRATLMPGTWDQRVDLQSEFPDASHIYKSAVDATTGHQIQSCEILIDKPRFIDRYPYCALAMSPTTGQFCNVSFSSRGGRGVQFTVVGAAGQSSAACSFVCLSR